MLNIMNVSNFYSMHTDSVEPKHLHIVSGLFCASCSLSELETDIKVFKDSLLKILDEDEIIEELCLTKWTDPRVLYVTHILTHTLA